MKVKFFIPKHEEVGDFVECCDCGRQMVVRCGSENCPACGAFGALKWANDAEHEVNVRDFKLRMRQQ